MHPDAEPPSSEELLRYLDEHATNEQKHAIEKKLSNASFESDAIEGLQQLKKEKLSRQVRQLNKHLLKQLRSKKDKKKFKDFHWFVLAIIIILFLCAVSYVVLMLL